MISTSRKYLFFIFVLSVITSAGCSRESTENSAVFANPGAEPPILATQKVAPLNVLVIGGTRGIGLEVVKLSLDRGHQVTALARRPERMPLTHERLQTLQGDITHAERMAEVVPEFDVVVSSIGMGLTRKPVTLFSVGMKNVLQAMSKVENYRLITVTGIGAGDSRGHGGFFYDRIFLPLALKTVYEDKDRQEALVRDSAVNWTIVRPGFLTDGPAEIRYRIFTDLKDVTAGKISRSDVAQFIVAAYEQELYVGETVLLTN